MKAHASKGFSLVEVAIATGITTFCLLTLFGLLPIGLNQSHYASAQTQAANFAAALNGDIRATSLKRAAVSPLYGFNIPVAGSPDVTSQSIYLSNSGAFTKVNERPGGDEALRATLWFSVPERTGMRNATMVRILITWPAEADGNPNEIPTHFSGAFEVLTALDRN
ncbi:MAG: hypothetical protein JWL90_3427 [Chthoniobacteraceae bacterium]|nr:hypothetical protein [Chthoniobacteraceae bacterium]